MSRPPLAAAISMRRDRSVGRRSGQRLVADGPRVQADRSARVRRLAVKDFAFVARRAPLNGGPVRQRDGRPREKVAQCDESQDLVRLPVERVVQPAVVVEHAGELADVGLGELGLGLGLQTPQRDLGGGADGVAGEGEAVGEEIQKSIRSDEKFNPNRISLFFYY